MALGLARTGRVVTAAALLMSISFAALIAAQVSFMRMFGVGLTLADRWSTPPWCGWCWCPRSCTCWGSGTGGRPTAGLRCTERIGISESGPPDSIRMGPGDPPSAGQT